MPWWRIFIGGELGSSDSNLRERDQRRKSSAVDEKVLVKMWQIRIQQVTHVTR